MSIDLKDEGNFTLGELQKKVIQNDIRMDIFDEDMERRRKLGLLNEKYTQCMRRLRVEWEPKFKEAGISQIPADDNDFAGMVFSHPDYKNRSQRDLESLGQ